MNMSDIDDLEDDFGSVLKRSRAYKKQHTKTLSADNKHERIILINEVCKRIGCGKSTLYAMSRAGKFPLAVRRGLSGVGWISSEVDAWIRDLPKIKIGRDDPK